MSTATLDRLIVLPITDPISEATPSVRLTCLLCGELVILVCEQYEEGDLCVCEDCERAGKTIGMALCSCLPCAQLAQELGGFYGNHHP